MLRHKGFENVEVFQSFLKTVFPSDVYYSCAYYENPEEEMTAKNWKGADLIFDIDADHIPTPCDRQHDTWQCKNCGKSGHGAKPRKCPKCKDQRFTSLSWPCDICLESAKKETIKLAEFLDSDFGFSPKEMTVAFSGHRGYHVQIENDSVKALDAMARKEIVDYLMGTGLEPTLHYFDPKKAWGSNLEDLGWGGRIARGTYELLSETREQLQEDGLKKIPEDINLQRKRILERWKEKGPWGLVKGVGLETWDKIIRHAIERQSVKIDTVVTADIHRLIRLKNTLHGETGLLKIEVPIDEIERFDPFNRAVAFSEGVMTVDVSDAPRFRLEDNFYGPYKNQRIELPTAAAMMLLCKGAAKIVEEKTVVQ